MPPKAPRPPKAAGKGNAATGTLGVKRRVQKPCLEKEKPESMSDADWAKDCHRREVSTKERYVRKEKKEARLLAASAAATVGSLVDGSSPAGSASRSSSPSESPFPMSETPRSHSRFTSSLLLSPEFDEPGGYGGYDYGYGNHGGFDPNAVFPGAGPSAGLSLDLNESLSMRRDAVHPGLHQSDRSLSFDTGAHHLFDESTCNMFGTPASSGVSDVQGQPSVHDDQEGEEAEGEMDQDGEEDAEGEEGAEEEEVGNGDADGAKSGKGRRPGGGTRGPTWTDAEDKCLIDSWSTITQEVTTGANQTSHSYWKRIKSEWDERRFHKDYIKYHMDRNQNALSHRWSVIQKLVNKFHGCLEQIMARPENGRTVKDQIIDACALYKETNKQKTFTLLHCFSKLQNCEKWKRLRRTLNKKGGGGEVEDVIASDGRPMGNKKGKAALAAAANSERVHSSIDKVLADVCKNFSERRLSCDAKWADLSEKAGKKLELAKSNAVVKKRREDFIILTTDTSNLDPLARAACERLRAAIYVEMGLAPAAAPNATPTPTPAPTRTQDATHQDDVHDAETQADAQTDTQRAQDAETQADAQSGEFTGMDFLGSTSAAGFLSSNGIINLE